MNLKEVEGTQFDRIDHQALQPFVINRYFLCISIVILNRVYARIEEFLNCFTQSIGVSNLFQIVWNIMTKTEVSTKSTGIISFKNKDIILT